MTGTPDDVQRAAAITQALDIEDTLGQRCRNLSEACWAVGQNADLLHEELIEAGWTPPGESVIPTEAYNRGRRDMADEHTPSIHAINSPEDWTPVPLRWRHVRPSDVFVADGRAWMVLTAGESGEHERWVVDVVSGEKQHDDVEIDPDEVVFVLCPVTEANALARVRDELGGTVVDRTA